MATSKKKKNAARKTAPKKRAGSPKSAATSGEVLLKARTHRLGWDESARVLSLEWDAASAGMAAKAYNQVMKRLASEAESRHPQALVLDERALRFRMSSEAQEFRQKEVNPRLNAAGVRRVAVVLPESAPLPADEPEGDGKAFRTSSFPSPLLARNWATTGYAVHLTLNYRVADDVDLSDVEATLRTFVANVRTRYPEIEYTSCQALDDERAFVHVVRAPHPRVLAAMQQESFFQRFGKWLPTIAADGPAFSRRRVVVSSR